VDFAEDGDDSVAVKRALKPLKTASARDAGSPELLLLQGRAQPLSNDAADAERSLQAAMGTLPVDPSVFRYLSTAAARLGRAGGNRAGPLGRVDQLKSCVLRCQWPA